ncbi:MAG: Uncharacterized MFS-type transporter, partial [uncultured Nocardioidaceae bacterium]
ECHPRACPPGGGRGVPGQRRGVRLLGVTDTRCARHLGPHVGPARAAAAVQCHRLAGRPAPVRSGRPALRTRLHRPRVRRHGRRWPRHRRIGSGPRRGAADRCGAGRRRLGHQRLGRRHERRRRRRGTAPRTTADAAVPRRLQRGHGARRPAGRGCSSAAGRCLGPACRHGRAGARVAGLGGSVLLRRRPRRDVDDGSAAGNDVARTAHAGHRRLRPRLRLLRRQRQRLDGAHRRGRAGCQRCPGGTGFRSVRGSDDAGTRFRWLRAAALRPGAGAACQCSGGPGGPAARRRRAGDRAGAARCHVVGSGYCARVPGGDECRRRRPTGRSRTRVRGQLHRLYRLPGGPTPHRPARRPCRYPPGSAGCRRGPRHGAPHGEQHARARAGCGADV